MTDKSVQTTGDLDQLVDEVLKVTGPEHVEAAAAGGQTAITLRVDVRDLRRARAAYENTRASSGHTSFGQFAARAMMAEVARLERENDASEPFA